MSVVAAARGAHPARAAARCPARLRARHLPGCRGPDAATIRAQELQAAPAGGGAGVKIGIIDDGIDQRHPFFDPPGYTMPPGFPKGQTSYTTAKVIVARAFPPPGATWKHAGKPFDPEQSGHAMHVAGIAAGNAGHTGAGRARERGRAARLSSATTRR